MSAEIFFKFYSGFSDSRVFSFHKQLLWADYSLQLRINLSVKPLLPTIDAMKTGIDITLFILEPLPLLSPSHHMRLE